VKNETSFCRTQVTVRTIEHGDVEILGNKRRVGLKLRPKYRTCTSKLKSKTRFIGGFISRV